MAMINGLHMAMQVNMPGPIMIMLMHVPAFINQLRAKQAAQDDEHDANGKLRGS